MLIDNVISYNILRRYIFIITSSTLINQEKKKHKQTKGKQTKHKRIQKVYYKEKKKQSQEEKK